MLYEIAGLVVERVVPLIAGTSSGGEFVGGGRVDGQMQRNGAVATVNIVEMLYEIAGLVVNGVVPLIAGTRGGGEFVRGDRVNG